MTDRAVDKLSPGFLVVTPKHGCQPHADADSIGSVSLWLFTGKTIVSQIDTDSRAAARQLQSSPAVRYDEEEQEST